MSGLVIVPHEGLGDADVRVQRVRRRPVIVPHEGLGEARRAGATDRQRL